jgi:hypothetical protein
LRGPHTFDALTCGGRVAAAVAFFFAKRYKEGKEIVKADERVS